jgi:HSP20 family protein
MVVEQRTTKGPHDEGARSETQNRQFLPATDIIETADAVILKLDMPGVAKEDVDLTVDKETLTIVGKTQPEVAGEAVYRETYIGDYQRQFTLTADVDPNKVTAAMNHGVLTVKIGKAEQVKPRKVKIAAAG